VTGALGALLGGFLAVGVALVVSGLIPSEPRPGPSHDRKLDYRRVGIRLGLAVIGAVAGWLLTRWAIGAATGAVVGWFFIRLLGASRRSRRAGTNKIEALAVWAEMLRDGFSAGSGLTTTVAATEHVAPAAIRSEVAQLCVRLRRPRPGAVESALRAFAAEIADPTGDTIVIALLLAARGKGADMRTLLSTLAVSARAEVNMRLEVEAKRAEILGQRRMIVGAVVLIATYLLVFRHDYLSPFGTPTGQVVFAGIVGVFAFSLWLMDRFSRLEAPQRTMQPEKVNP
jgi:hypothetical protein